VTSSERAVRLLTALVSAGVRDVVLAPGSRSAPLAIALYAADVAGDVRLHVRIDERTAGFLALGLSTGSRRPVAVVTTSGTAVGNLLPAVMEAHHSGRKVVVVSADRPDDLRGSGANQTTEQAGIFGTFAPCADLTPDTSDDALEAAVLAACRREGPSQLNLQLTPPLLPGGPDTEHAPWWPAPGSTDRPAPPQNRDAPSPESGWSESGSGTGARSARGSGPGRGPGGSAPGAEVLARGPRTVVVAGDDAGSPARILAERAGWPLLAEPTSGARVGANAIRTYRLLLATELAAGIERVVVLGHPTLSRPVTTLISREDLEVLAAPGPGGIVTDPAHVARHLDAVPEVDRDVPPTGADLDWLRAWQDADAALSARLDDWVDAQPGLTPAHVAREVAAAVTPDATLVVGSSNPVRDLDLMTVPYPPHEHRFVVGNRGLAGIDGTVSSAIGVALGRRRTSRTIAVLGDLTFLHDSNGLIIGPDEPRPDLTLVVVNDDGGSIFAGLEQGSADYAPAFERVFGTPHGVDVEALCRASHTAYERVSTAEELRRVLVTDPRGIRVVEARVSRADRRADAAAIAALVKD